MSSAVLDLDGGRVVASRRQIDALAAWSLGRGEPGDPVVRELVDAGLIADGVVHPAVAPVVCVVRRVDGRVVVRRWSGGRRPVVEVFAGPAGVLVLPGGHELDTPQELRWHPRRTALARVVAGILRVPPDDGPPVFDRRPRPWADLVAAAADPGGPTLVDLRWAPRPGAPIASVIALAWAPIGGVVEVEPTDREGIVVCRPRHPVEVWTGLARLADPAGLGSGAPDAV